MPSSLKRTASIRDSPELEDIIPKKNRRVHEESDEEEDMEGYDEEEDEEQAAPMNIDFENMSVNLAGTIARVEVVNFMCHKYLKVDLGPKINFVIGHNGSGKSAILTAITLCLGANASATNRGKSVSSFIKEGTNAANITIHLTNGGPSPYKPDLYPNMIVVERRLNKEGASPYKLKNISGKIVSQKKEDLVSILDHFGILVNNPLTMLTQDMARKFLSDSTSEDKYKLFLHGTQLTQLRNEFETIRESLDTSVVTLQRKSESLPRLREEAMEAQRRYTDLENVQNIDDKIDELNNQLVWSQIIVKEKEAERLKEQVDLAEKKLQEFDLIYEEQKKKIDHSARGIENAKDELEAAQNIPDETSEEKRELINTKVRLVAKVSDFKEELTRINGIIKQTKALKLKHQTALQIETDKLEASTRLKRDEIVGQIDKLKEKMQDKAKKGKQFAIEGQELANEISEAKDKRQRQSRELADLRKKSDELRNLIGNLESQRGNRMRAYGANMPRVLDEIRRESRWKKRRPIGPMGSTLKLLKPQFGDVLEQVLNKSLNSFVVECFEDKNLLLSILRRNRMAYVSIMVAEYDLFDYSSGEPSEEYLTVLRAFHFEDEWVKRQFIIFNKIEKIILMEDRAEADNVMYSNPRNVDLCFTSSGHKVGSRSGMKTETIDQYRGPSRFQTDVDAQIRKHNHALEEFNKQYEEIEIAQKRSTEAINELEKRMRQCKNSEIRIESEIKSLERQVEIEEDKLREDDPVDLNMYHEDIKECDEKNAAYVAQFQDISEQRKPLVEELKEIENKLRAIQRKEEKRDGEIREHRSKIEKLLEMKSKLQSKLDEYKNQRQILKSRYEAKKTTYHESLNLVKQWTEECIGDYPDRVETTKTPREIELELKKLEETVKSIEAELGQNFADFGKYVKDTVQAWHDAEEVIKGMERLNRSLRKMLVKRQEKWTQFRDFMSLSARHYFSYYLHLRGDEGALKFNHQQKQLAIRVATGDQYSKGSRHKDSRSLSGGEKSFSQISLLLSLWQSISSPIICLDEFDVFMDAVNRRQTMSMIMNAASDNSSQYILITPQDASGMKPGKFVTIHRLADPERYS